MPIQFTCPYCGRQTNVADQYAGQSGPCAGCGQVIAVPAPGSLPAYPAPRKSSGTSTLVVVLVASLGVLVVCGGILAALLLPAVQASREVARRAQCTNNLRQIGVALHMYHQTYGCFPPAYVADKNGKPMVSWRVLILPFLEQDGIYKQYKLNEPFDSPSNRRFANVMMPVFQCPSEAMTPGNTSYVMIVGPRTISNGTGSRKMAEITDGTSNTIMIIEVANSGINWLEPKDLKFEDLAKMGAGPGASGISSQHPGAVNVLMCDGSVRTVSTYTAPQQLQAAATIDGNEPVTLP